MTIIEQIKAEIERRKGYISVTHFAEELLSFLSTLESEKLMNQDEVLNEEIKKEMAKLPFFIRGKDLIAYARHFAQWGAEHAKIESEKPVPNDLEEAARHSEILTYPMPEDGDIEKVFKVQEARFFHEIGFIAGAKWQKEQDTREMIMSDGSYFQKCYELGKKDILSKFTKEHLEGLKWIERTGISTQPVPYHKYCKDLYKVLEEILKEKYDTQGDTSI